jgi:hypothetical protein
MHPCLACRSRGPVKRLLKPAHTSKSTKHQGRGIQEMHPYASEDTSEEETLPRPALCLGRCSLPGRREWCWCGEREGKVERSRRSTPIFFVG